MSALALERLLTRADELTQTLEGGGGGLAEARGVPFVVAPYEADAQLAALKEAVGKEMADALGAALEGRAKAGSLAPHHAAPRELGPWTWLYGT